MLRYNSVLDQYTEFNEDGFSDDDDDDDISLTSTIYTPQNFWLFSSRRSRPKRLQEHKASRIIRKSGRLNIFISNLPAHKHILYIRDLGNTLLTIRWRWILFTLCAVNFLSFLLFSLLWMLMAYFSGDFDANPTSYCVENTKSFSGYFLLSVETIMTIGYGVRYPTEKCHKGWLILVSQALVSVAIQGALVSAVYVKISKPFIRISNSLFSKKAIICMRDGKLRFIFRIHDFTGKIWCCSKLSLYFINKDTTDGYQLQKMQVEPHGLLIFPLEIEHVIDAASPLWDFEPMDILQRNFEIVAVAEGNSMITGQTSQNRTSYVSSDIRWGHRFMPCVDLDEQTQKYVVHYGKFKQTCPFDAPLCSGKELQDIQTQNL